MDTDIDTIYIGGEWVTPSSTSKIAIQSPATGERVGSVIAAGERDVDRAVSAARAAFDDPSGWSNWEPADRAAVLNEFARQYQLTAEDMVRTVCQENGMPIGQAAQLEGAVPGMLLTYYAGLIEKLPVGETRQAQAGTRTLVFTYRRRCRRGDHAVECSADTVGVQVRAGAGRRLHRGTQAVP